MGIIFLQDIKKFDNLIIHNCGKLFYFKTKSIQFNQINVSICLNAKWNCRAATSEEVALYPKENNVQTICDSSKNKEFTTCEPIAPLTCKVNMLLSNKLILL